MLSKSFLQGFFHALTGDQLVDTYQDLMKSKTEEAERSLEICIEEMINRDIDYKVL